jgi:hypothetical protein
LTLTDVVIALVALALLGGGLLPGVVRGARSVATISKCASQLKQIGEAVHAYALSNSGSFPRARWDPTTTTTTQYTGSSVPDTFAPAVLSNDVTAALFMLVRGRYVSTDVFYCPSSRATPWKLAPGSEANYANFPSRAHLSFGLNDPYMPQEAERFGFRWNNGMSAEYALAADMSPGGAALGTVSVIATAKEMAAVNSPNHHGYGQNVLFGDAHVEFLQNPFVGVQRDDIYTAAAQPISKTNVPVWTDSHILPTYIDGPQPRAYLGGSPLGFVGVAAALVILAVLLLVVLSLRGRNRRA